MRIVYLADAPYVHTRRWLEHFAALGHECEVVSFRPATIDGVRVHYLGGLERLGKARYLLQARRVARLVRSREPDLVHALHLTSYGFLAALAGVRPFVTSVWGMDIFEAPGRSPFHRWITRYALARADAITATGVQLAAATARYAPAGAKVAVVPYGVDFDLFRPGEPWDRDNIVIGSAARLSPEKGLRYLLEAFAGAASDDSRLRLRIAGEGPEEAPLRRLAERLGIADRTEFVGWVEHQRMPAFLQSLDVFVLPSLHESFGVAAVEAAAVGLPVIASDVQGLPDVVVDGVTGVLLPAKDVAALARAISVLATDRAKRETMGEAGRRVVAERYDWAENARRMECIYEGLTARLAKAATSV
jgi:glycosyltransferase involved in cell wall biosynthesis